MKKGQCPYEKASLVPRFPAYSSLTGTVSHGHLDPQGIKEGQCFNSEQNWILLGWKMGRMDTVNWLSATVLYTR